MAPNLKLESWTVRHEALVVGLITLAAALLRVYKIDTVSLHGDEFTSIQEAARLGLNLHSMPYFLLLRAWSHIGSSDLTLRLLSAVLGTLAVPVTYLVGKELLGSPVSAALAALLNAASAYAIEYSQQVRFYSLFLLTSSLAFLAFTRYLRREDSRPALWFLLAADLLCMISHALGFVVVLIQAAYLASGKKRGPTAVLIVGLCAFAVLGLATWRAQWFASPFHWLEHYEGVYGNTQYGGPRGLQLSNVAKIPIALFIYLFGMSVYPGKLWLTLPGLGLFAFLIVRGILALRSRPSALRLVALWIALPPLLLFLIFDALVPPSFVGADARYIIYVLLGIQVTLAAGLMSLGRAAVPAAGLCGIVTVATLALYYYPSWSHSDRLDDWKPAARFVTGRALTNSLVLFDGRSSEGVQRYFPQALRREGLGKFGEGDSFDELQRFDQIFVVSNDFNSDVRRSTNRFLENIQRRFEVYDSYVQYPLFVMAMRKAGQSDDPAASVADVAAAPSEVYGLEFADLSLPRTVRWDGRQLRIVGGSSIPGPDGEQERIISPAGLTTGSALIVLSSLVDAGSGVTGRPVAEVLVQGSNERPERFLLRDGVETNDWSQPCPAPVATISNCAIADSWRKRIALLGRRAYPGAWREFDAHIFAAKFRSPAPMTGDPIRVRYLLDRGYLQIWGLQVAD